MYKAVFIRHGESVWNKKNIFTGWVDVGLSEKGRAEAKRAGEILKERGHHFDIAFSSVQKRAVETLDIVLDVLGQKGIEKEKSWRLNERHYGGLQGKNKKDIVKKFGAEQAHLWRRSWDVKPPLLEKIDKMFPGNDPVYIGLIKKGEMSEADLPLSECLKDNWQRMLPYWQKKISPAIKAGKRALVSAHGSSLRALVKYLDNISDKEVEKLNIPTGIPLVYDFDDNMRPIDHYYLASDEEVAKAVEQVINQSRI